MAIPLTVPQSNVYRVGGEQAIKAAWNISRYVDIGPSVTFLALRPRVNGEEVGTAWAFGGGLRLKRPHDTDREGLYAASPWVDFDALYVRTGPLNRFGFAVGAGISAPLGDARAFWLGPFVRYHHILQQPERAGFDNQDAKIISVGLSLELGSGIERERGPMQYAAAHAPDAPAAQFFCPDQDGDGMPDGLDHCLAVAGPIENWGCPNYKALIIKRNKLELTEKLYFAQDEALLLEASFPILDEVVLALKQNTNFRVQVEGHASSEGADAYNQTLSEERAAVVLSYLASNGIGRERLASKGYGSDFPLASNATQAGREDNRRVEFVVHFIILNEGNK